MLLALALQIRKKCFGWTYNGILERSKIAFVVLGVQLPLGSCMPNELHTHGTVSVSAQKHPPKNHILMAYITIF